MYKIEGNIVWLTVKSFQLLGALGKFMKHYRWVFGAKIDLSLSLISGSIRLG
jgi:hypothetical protein